VDVQTILTAARTHLETITPNHQLVIEAESLPMIRADVTRIVQVLTNLVQNAAKFSPPQTKITITAVQSGSFVVIRVADQGSGISPENRPGIFQAFRQEKESASSEGVGLGLAICKGIVDAHGGQIWLEEHEGPGTVFAFTLPLSED
jgi:signal transduction histidine kinase